MNREIRKSPVRLIAHDGEQLGVVTLREALERADTVRLDLVEVGATSDPPVVKIMDWGKVKFEKEKKAKEARKKTKTIEIKEVKFRPTVGDHDFDRKVDRTRKFIEKGNKVKVTIFFRARQLRRPDLGSDMLTKIASMTEDISEVESRSKLESRRMIMILSPKSS